MAEKYSGILGLIYSFAIHLGKVYSALVVKFNKEKVLNMKSATKSSKPAILVVTGLILVILAVACAGQPQVTNLTLPTSQQPAQPTNTSQPTDTTAIQAVASDTPAAGATATTTDAAATATDVPSPTPASSGVSFSRDVLPIFQANCIGCHGADRQAAGLDLSNYASIMNTSPAIVPNDPNNSAVLQAVIQGLMPRGGQPLSQQEIQTITDWINAGAPNN